jgi:hypothetical protein
VHSACAWPALRWGFENGKQGTSHALIFAGGISDSLVFAFKALKHVLEAYLPVATALRTIATISGGRAILIFSAVVADYLLGRIFILQ